MSNFQDKLSVLQGRKGRLISVVYLSSMVPSSVLHKHLLNCLLFNKWNDSKAESETRGDLNYTIRFNLAEDLVRSLRSPDCPAPSHLFKFRVFPPFHHLWSDLYRSALDGDLFLSINKALILVTNYFWFSVNILKHLVSQGTLFPVIWRWCFKVYISPKKRVDHKT